MQVNGGNVDNEEDYHLLVEYKDCLLIRFKEGSKAAETVRDSLKDSLLEELRLRFVENIPDEVAEVGVEESDVESLTNQILQDNEIDSIQNTLYDLTDVDGQINEDPEDPLVYGGTKNQGIYDVVGYVLHSRCRHILKCPECKILLQTEQHLLPKNFLAADHTARRSYGGLKFPSVNMFKTFKEVEKVVTSHFQSKNHYYVRDAYQNVISKIGQLSLINVSCTAHPHVLPHLIFEYVQIRFYFESKRIRNIEMSKTTSQMKAFAKHSRLV